MYSALKENIENIVKINEYCRKVCDTIGISPEGELFSHLVLTIEPIVKLLEHRYNDTHWIDWYVYECECGRTPLEAGYDDNMRIIECVGDLIWLLEGSKDESK